MRGNLQRVQRKRRQPEAFVAEPSHVYNKRRALKHISLEGHRLS